MNRISYPNKFLYPIVVGKMEEIVAAPEEENGAWTAEIMLFDYNDKVSNAEIRMVMDNAPHHLLVSGAEFILSSGYRVSDKKLVIEAIGRIK